ncbi:hypothetical protein HEB94_007277 [Actinopolymorpha pittospori]|uniref:Uncharacterized protein n=1 Tax=Actinopolymorpha pittospori TaxID=648752 RepID=A0A927RCZ4_9ACTN|nr:hypothetical protein [Actinopolymorpha pittospori]
MNRVRAVHGTVAHHPWSHVGPPTTAFRTVHSNDATLAVTAPQRPPNPTTSRPPVPRRNPPNSDPNCQTTTPPSRRAPARAPRAARPRPRTEPR